MPFLPRMCFTRHVQQKCSSSSPSLMEQIRGKSVCIADPQIFSVYVFSWNKTSNPEPWNKLDPTYQYKVTHSVYIHPYEKLDDILTVMWFLCLSLWPSPPTIKTWRRMDQSFESHAGLLLQTKLKKKTTEKEEIQGQFTPPPPSEIFTAGGKWNRSQIRMCNPSTSPCLVWCLQRMVILKMWPGMSGRIDPDGTYDYWKRWWKYAVCLHISMGGTDATHAVYVQHPLKAQLSWSISL